MKRWLGFALGAMICAGGAWAYSAAPTEGLRTFMRAKLKHSQEVVEGLAVENFDQIARSAQEMSLLSRAEAWQVFTTKEYLDHSNDFRRAAESLRDAAKKKNLDGAALAYLDVTMKCINCHKYVRKVRTAALDTPAPR